MMGFVRFFEFDQFILYMKKNFIEKYFVTMTHLDGDEPLFSTLSVHTKPILEALQRLKVQRHVLRQDVCGDEAHDLLVRAWEVRACLVDEPLFATHTVLSTLVLRGRKYLVSTLHNTLIQTVIT